MEIECQNLKHDINNIHVWPKLFITSQTRNIHISHLTETIHRENFFLEILRLEFTFGHMTIVITIFWKEARSYGNRISEFKIRYKQYPRLVETFYYESDSGYSRLTPTFYHESDSGYWRLTPTF